MVKRLKKKKITELQRLYKKQEKRIKQIIYREWKKDNYIDITDILPDRPKRVTRQSISRLEKMTPKVVRQKATKVLHKRQREFEQAGKEAEKNGTFEAFRKAEDKKQKEFLEVSKKEKRVELYQQERFIVKKAIIDEINEFKSIDIKLSNFLMSVLRDQVNDYGLDAVLDSIAFLPSDFIETTRAVFKYGNGSQTARQLIRLTQAITGTVLDSEMLKRFGEIAEKMDIKDWNPNNSIVYE